MTQPKPSFLLLGFILLNKCHEQANLVNTDNKTELQLNVEDMTMQYSLEQVVGWIPGEEVRAQGNCIVFVRQQNLAQYYGSIQSKKC